jgi:hypothetical protein
LTRPIARGRYAAAVSIRSGYGSHTHDRVLRFVPDFDSPGDAARYATAQAMAWIGTAPLTRFQPQPPQE